MHRTLDKAQNLFFDFNQLARNVYESEKQMD